MTFKPGDCVLVSKPPVLILDGKGEMHRFVKINRLYYVGIATPTTYHSGNIEIKENLEDSSGWWIDPACLELATFSFGTKLRLKKNTTLPLDHPIFAYIQDPFVTISDEDDAGNVHVLSKQGADFIIRSDAFIRWFENE